MTKWVRHCIKFLGRGLIYKFSFLLSASGSLSLCVKKWKLAQKSNCYVPAVDNKDTARFKISRVLQELIINAVRFQLAGPATARVYPSTMAPIFPFSQTDKGNALWSSFWFSEKYTSPFLLYASRANTTGEAIEGAIDTPSMSIAPAHEMTVALFALPEHKSAGCQSVTWSNNVWIEIFWTFPYSSS